MYNEIDEFWRFWHTHHQAIRSAIEGGTLPHWHERISMAVQKIYPDLKWKVGPGRNALHYFCLSGGGRTELRLVTERWLQRSPPTSRDWEFYPAVPASPSIANVTVGQLSLAFDDFRIFHERGTDRLELEIEVYHPAWSHLALGEMQEAGYAFLDAAFGEDEVARWFGVVNVCADPREGSGKLSDLRARIAQLAAQTGTGKIFEECYANVDGVEVTFVDTRIKRVDYIGLDAHIKVDIPLQRPAQEGRCDPSEEIELRRLEDELVEMLGSEVLFMGRSTMTQVRTLHLRAASHSSALLHASRWALQQAREVDVLCFLDPGWRTTPMT